MAALPPGRVIARHIIAPARLGVDLFGEPSGGGGYASAARPATIDVDPQPWGAGSRPVRMPGGGPMKKIVVGLGNPGARLREGPSQHRLAGLLDRLADRLSASGGRVRSKDAAASVRRHRLGD